VSFSASTKGLDLQQMANMYNDDGMRGEAPDLHMCNLKVLSFGVWVVLCCVGCVVWHHTTCKSLKTAVQARPWRILPCMANYFGPYQHNSSFPAHWVEIRAKIRCMSGPYLKRRPKTDIKPVSVISNPVDSFTSALPQFPISPSTVRSPVSRGQ